MNNDSNNNINDWLQSASWRNYHDTFKEAGFKNFKMKICHFSVEKKVNALLQNVFVVSENLISNGHVISKIEFTETQFNALDKYAKLRFSQAKVVQFDEEPRKFYLQFNEDLDNCNYRKSWEALKEYYTEEDFCKSDRPNTIEIKEKILIEYFPEAINQMPDLRKKINKGILEIVDRCLEPESNLGVIPSDLMAIVNDFRFGVLDAKYEELQFGKAEFRMNGYTGVSHLVFKNEITFKNSLNALKKYYDEDDYCIGHQANSIEIKKKILNEYLYLLCGCEYREP